MGLSRGGPYLFRAFLWQNNTLYDVNQLTLSGSPFLLYAGDIDQQGRIVGEALDLNTGEAPGFTATPVPPGIIVSSRTQATPQGSLPESVRRQIARRLAFGFPDSDQ